ncbi:hypothetical protein DFH08DRAFT_413462 [Mycena albidolilacea]|uniref:Uncharacterized protein n=1 Tax=Mycena albidolilacea TaxID=1033008 RepID=A0AAD7AIJ0_9AGAR|nr:hypothetical protein DFH08DRAFT_413462 [Mycena albidolilacea]
MAFCAKLWTRGYDTDDTEGCGYGITRRGPGGDPCSFLQVADLRWLASPAIVSRRIALPAEKKPEKCPLHPKTPIRRPSTTSTSFLLVLYLFSFFFPFPFFIYLVPASISPYLFYRPSLCRAICSEVGRLAIAIGVFVYTYVRACIVSYSVVV